MKLALDKLHPKYRTAIFAVGIASFIFVTHSFLLNPQWEQIENLKNQNQTGKMRVQVVEAFSLAHPNTDQYLIELDQKKAHADKMLPDRSDVSDFLVLLDQASKDCGIQLTHIKFSPAVNKNGYREIPLEILIRGDYFQTINFLTKMESLPRFNSINRVVTQSKEKVLETKLTVAIYSFGVTQNQNTAEPAKK